MPIYVRAIFGAIVCALALLVSVQASAQDDQTLTYKVKRGDTLYALANRYLVGQRATDIIAKRNDIRDPRKLGTGTVLQIPRSLLRYEIVQLRVLSFSGPVEVSGRTPVAGGRLNGGGLVATGANGFITFRGNRGATLSLPSNTRARLLRARQYILGDILDVDFSITQGRGEIIAPELEEQERFQIRTPLAVTSVRGTVFRVAHDPQTQVSITEVAEGAVVVEAGGQTKMAQSGFGVPLTAAGVGELEALLPAPSIAKPGAVQTEPDLSFAIVPLNGAVLYRTQIAKDAGFLEVVGEDITAQSSASFSSLPNGTYFVRSRGISPTGVEGLSEVYSFKRKRLGVSASTEPSIIEDGFKFSWLADGAADSSFAFQLWSQDTPAYPIVDEVGIQDLGFIVTGLDPGIYEWRVAAVKVDADGLLKVWSPNRKLTVSK